MRRAPQFWVHVGGGLGQDGFQKDRLFYRRRPRGHSCNISRSLVFGCCGAPRAHPANFAFLCFFLEDIFVVLFGGLKLGMRGIDYCVTRSISTFGVVLSLFVFQRSSTSDIGVLKLVCPQTSYRTNGLAHFVFGRRCSQPGLCFAGVSASMGCAKYCPAGSCAGCRPTNHLQKDGFLPQGCFFSQAAASKLEICKFVLRLSCAHHSVGISAGPPCLDGG